MLPCYTLLDRQPIPATDILSWAGWFETNIKQCIVARDDIGGITISTVFLGVDVGSEMGLEKGDRLPIVFETMMFRGKKALPSGFRYTSWKDAEEGHSMLLKDAKLELENGE